MSSSARGLLTAALLLWAGALSALELKMPAGARLISERDSAFDSYALPTGPWELGLVNTQSFEGRIDRQSWRLESAAITTLQLLDPLRAQLDAAGYELLFECEDVLCGGFDFRFAIEVIPAPDMHVDIRDFRFVSARRGDAAISLLVSRSRASAYVQIIRVEEAESATLQILPDSAAPVQGPEGTNPLSVQLIDQGHVVLSDLDFGSGTAELGQVRYISLTALATFLQTNPNAQIALVGHTDATGALDVNIALSRKRAEAVRDRLAADYGVSQERMRAEGMGYLAPRASNLTQDGREQNRRVEVILLSLD